MQPGDLTADFVPHGRAKVPGLTVFGRYRLERILGQGGMGVVWLARDDKLDEMVALKFLPDAVRASAASVEELKRETRKSRQLTHPNIVRIHDFAEDADNAAISMEFIDGQSLAERRARLPESAFQPGQICGWILQVCAALEYAHEEARIVHRDLKPANIMVNSSGRAKITDFGISRSISDSFAAVSAYQARPGSGSPPYMSPQQASGDPATELDDIYGLGATIYDLLTGKPPFYTGDIFKQVETRTAPRIAERRRELGVALGPVPAEWESLVAACLSKDPLKRPASAREVARLVQNLPIEEPVVVDSPTIPLAPAQPPPITPPPITPPPATPPPITPSPINPAPVTPPPITPPPVTPPPATPSAGFAGVPTPPPTARPATVGRQTQTAGATDYGPSTRRGGSRLLGLAVGIFVIAGVLAVAGGLLLLGLWVGLEPGGGAHGPPPEPTPDDPVPAPVVSPGSNIKYDTGIRFKPVGFEPGRWVAARMADGTYPVFDAKTQSVDADAEFDLPAGALPGSVHWQNGREMLYAGGPLADRQWASVAGLIKEAARGGSPGAQFMYGKILTMGWGSDRDPVAAARWYSLAAEKGHPPAQNNLGLAYQHGEGVAQDDERAFELLKRAASSGLAIAQSNLAFCYLNGTGTPRDTRLAAENFLKAAKQGYPPARAMMGALISDGTGYAQNDAAALAWFRLAADQNDPSGFYFLGRAYDEGRGVRKNPQEAARFYRLAAEAGITDAQNELGELLMGGRGIPRNDHEALSLFRQAAAEGSTVARNNLALMLREGRGTEKDYKESARLFKISAAEGDSYAQFHLSLAYLNGWGVSKDDGQAMKLARASAQQGNTFGQVLLGLMHEGGRGVPQNTHEAVRLYREAASQGNEWGAAQLRQHGIQPGNPQKPPPKNPRGLPPAPLPDP